MRDSRNPDVAWLYARLEAMGRPDCSDSGMVYFLLSGNEQPNIEDLNRLLHGNIPATVAQRPSIRLEAENFQFNNFTVPQKKLGSGVSQRMAAQLATSKAAGSIRATFQELYAASGRYDIEVRYFDAKEGRCEFALRVNSVQQGETWTASSRSGTWRTRTIPNVAINMGDEIMVKVQADGTQTGGLDYLQLNHRPGATGAASVESP